MQRGLIRSTLAVAAILGGSMMIHAQAAQPAAGQRGAGGAPAKAEAPSPPAPKHDLTGVWMMRNPPGTNRGYTNYTYTDPKTDSPTLTAWGQDQFAKAKDSNGGKYTLQETNDPVLTKCWPPGVPRVYFHPYPFEFVQTPKEMLMIYEYDHWLRRIYTDGRPIPTDPDETWMGTSVGHWDGDTTFVVDTVGFNEKTWLDRIGHPHSNQLHVTEKFRRVDFNHMQIDFIMEDKKALAKPWTATFYYELRPGWELGEISCSGDYLDFSKFEDPNVKTGPPKE